MFWSNPKGRDPDPKPLAPLHQARPEARSETWVPQGRTASDWVSPCLPPLRECRTDPLSKCPSSPRCPGRGRSWVDRAGSAGGRSCWTGQGSPPGFNQVSALWFCKRMNAGACDTLLKLRAPQTWLLIHLAT